MDKELWNSGVVFAGRGALMFSASFFVLVAHLMITGRLLTDRRFGWKDEGREKGNKRSAV